MSTERPILFNGQMVRAILDGKKTQTRRVMKPWQPSHIKKDACRGMNGVYFDALISTDNVIIASASTLEEGIAKLQCQLGKAGDRLWVRETFLHQLNGGSDQSGERYNYWGGPGSKIEYIANGAKPRHLYPNQYNSPYMAKRPSIHMPRWASRITLEITDIRAEKLHDISEQDAIAEGLTAATKDGVLTKYGMPEWPWSAYDKDPRVAFRRLWGTVYGDEDFGCLGNPWVWVVEFKRLV